MVELLDSWGQWYLAIQGLAVALTAFLPPLPSEAMVITSGALAADGSLSLSATLAVTFLGCLIGDLALYFCLKRHIIRVLHRWRWGRGLHRMMLRTAIRAGGVNTWVGLLLIRWIPAGRTASMVCAGLMKLPPRHVAALAVLGGVIWASWQSGLGYITGTTTGLPPWVSALTGIAVGTLVGLIIAVLWSRRRQGSAQVPLKG